MQGEFTLGGIMAFQGFLKAFMSPAMTIIQAGQTIQEMRTQMERIDDVMEYPSDVNVVSNTDTSGQSLRKLKGNVELKNITFGYSKLAPPLIKNFSMTLKPGSRVAFVGTSGCGKSTLMRLLLGFEKPELGAIYYDNKDMKSIDLCSLRRKIGAVTQNGGLFQGDIFSNITSCASKNINQLVVPVENKKIMKLHPKYAIL